MTSWLLLVSVLAASLHADVLIGDKPCLWKRPVTATRQELSGWDTAWVEDSGQICFYKSRHCNQKIFIAKTRPVLDTTGWERYWDKCPKEKK